MKWIQIVELKLSFKLKNVSKIEVCHEESCHMM